MVDDMVVAPPHRALRGAVSRYVGYRSEHGAVSAHRGLPGLGLTFIVSLGDPVRTLDQAGGSVGRGGVQGFVAGVHDTAVLVERPAVEHGIAVEMSLLAARGLLGCPAGELAGRSVELGDLLGPAGRRLVDRVREASDWRTRFAALDDELCRLLPDAPVGPVPEVAASWASLVGQASALQDVAAATGWSRQHLTRVYRREVGVTPQALRRLARFDRSVQALRGNGGPINFAEVAYLCGYVDQSHMINDWHRLAGCTPVTWWRDEVLGVF